MTPIESFVFCFLLIALATGVALYIWLVCDFANSILKTVRKFFGEE